MEYNFYKECRNRLLQQPHARAALLEGGIVWRLARDCIGDDSESIVLGGPSCDVLAKGMAIKHGKNEDDWLWDDAICDRERDITCGVYHVYTGECFAKRFFFFWGEGGFTNFTRLCHRQC